MILWLRAFVACCREWWSEERHRGAGPGVILRATPTMRDYLVSARDNRAEWDRWYAHMRARGWPPFEELTEAEHLWLRRLRHGPR